MDGPNWSMSFIVATERLGVPGAESGVLERKGYIQKSLKYPAHSDQPSATCHLQSAEHQNALCGYQWEGLIAVPGAKSFDDVSEELRCPKCEKASQDSGT
jgi:rubredoxin